MKGHTFQRHPRRTLPPAPPAVLERADLLLATMMAASRGDATALAMLDSWRASAARAAAAPHATRQARWWAATTRYAAARVRLLLGEVLQ